MRTGAPLDYKRWPHVREAMLGGFHIPKARWLTGQNKLYVRHRGPSYEIRKDLGNPSGA